MFMRFVVSQKDKARHEKMVSFVERMLELHKSSPRTPQDKERVKREIESHGEWSVEKG